MITLEIEEEEDPDRDNKVDEKKMLGKRLELNVSDLVAQEIGHVERQHGDAKVSCCHGMTDEPVALF